MGDCEAIERMRPIVATERPINNRGAGRNVLPLARSSGVTQGDPVAGDAAKPVWGKGTEERSSAGPDDDHVETGPASAQRPVKVMSASGVGSGQGSMAHPSPISSPLGINEREEVIKRFTH
jgi:hypothetical protein